QVSAGRSVAEACFQGARLQMQHLRDDTAISDVVFLSQNNELGLAFVEKCTQHMVGDSTSLSARESVLHTFVDKNMDNAEFGQEDRNIRIYENSRRKKLAFYMGDARIKATTLHSFKGWEGRHLILFVSRISSDKDRALFYTALTRLKKHPNGSMLTVVSSCPELRDFGYRNFSPGYKEC
ncbi:MAG: hypothetical protein OXU23_09265, partial [Candidatus Poribacteria bacterium]|nr:hypothetical protein [Candidatus Poribacteria bacterium]